MARASFGFDCLMGMLGGRLEQRQAALSGVMAAGSRLLLLIPCLPLISKALRVPRKYSFWKDRSIECLMTFHVERKR